ncbi:hypothetical protein I4U23_014128 [Adineta vaga]|nr:hypothetical protein I4U23_014128 [Adineta vaga]
MDNCSRRPIRYARSKTSSLFRSFYRRYLGRAYTTSSYSLPVTPQIEHRELGPRRPIQEMEFDLWSEPDAKPVFTFKLRPRLIQEGVGVKLICCVSGKPPPKVHWFKERTQLSDTDSHYMTSCVHGVCTLEITACETSDSAMYRCGATNPLGSDETSCLMHVEEVRRTRRAHSIRPGDGDTSRGASRARSPSPLQSSGRDSSWRDKLGVDEKPAQRDTLEVEKPKRKERRDPPKFSEQLIDITMFEGSTAKLCCTVKGKPTPKIEWLKNGESLTTESRIQETYDDDVATLVIKKVKVEDDGEYICRATNEEGSDTSSAQLTIKAHVPGENEDAYAASLAQEDETSVKAEPQATIEEPVASETPIPEPTEGAASETAAKVEEKLPSEAVAEVPESANISTEPTPVEAPVGSEPEPTPVTEPIPVPEPTPVAEPAKPTAGKAAPAKKPATPAAPEKKPVGAAALKKPEPTKKVEEKKEPAKKTEEKKEPAKKPADDKKKTEEVQPKVEEPAPAEPEKKKEEEEKVESKKNETEEPAEEKPAEPKIKFLKYIKSQNLMEGDSLTLECSCDGAEEDDLELNWLRNNKEIPDNPDFRRERSGNSFKLVVAEVFPEDSGVFSALLKSKSTKTEHLSSCSVIIQARDEEPLDPSFVQFPQSLCLEEGGKAKFTCQLSGATPMTAEWQINGKALDRESSRFVFTNNETDFTLEIPVILATDQGLCQVTVSNDKGEITSAFSLHVHQS